MTTLAAHQELQMINYNNKTAIKNGIDCNDCGEELYDTLPGTIEKLGPPETPVNCLTCGYKGYRIDLIS